MAKETGKAGNSGKDKGADKTPGQILAEKLCFNPKNCWEAIDAKTEKEIEDFSAAYRKMLDRGKTEREFCTASVELLEKNGFVNIDSKEGRSFKAGKLAAGAKVFKSVHGKALIAAVTGKRPPIEGLHIIGAHIDSPRIDLKQNPLYEDSDFALLDTHYYGGIKKYQWTAIPLSMHGVFIDSNGKKIEACLGEEEDDPVFTISDLLPHLAKDQMQKKLTEAIEGEDLDVLAGSRPYADEKVKEKVKLRILSLLNEKYGITEESFAGAEIEFVPAFKARDIGFDRSMIGAYGHDDRCCAYPALMALLEFTKKAPEHTVLCYLSDKEEIGSTGNTGADSWGFENFAAFLAGEENLRRCLENSSMLSADVNAAFDPSYAAVFDKKNSSFMGKGLVLQKYTGSGGKSHASDADAEYCSRVQALMTRKKIPWQCGELGKVDKGGGGTIALHAARMGINVLDAGVPVLSMHSPFEVISKVDLYYAYKGYAAFFAEI
jgi:aspartyl aminopeptidase